MRSIQTKFIALMLSCVLLASIVIGGAGILNAQRVIDGDSAQIMNLLCRENAAELDALFSRIEQSVKTLSVYTLEQLESVERLSGDPDYLEDYTGRLESAAVNAAENTEGALAVYVRFNPELTPPTSGLFWSRSSQQGHFQELVPTDFSRYAPSDTEHVGWYYIPVEHGRAVWMSPYLNQNLDVEMVSYVIPIYRDNVTVGVVGMDIDFRVIEQAVGDIRVYDSGYAFLVDDGGLVMYHPEYGVGTSMSGLSQQLRPVETELSKGDSGGGLFSYEWNGARKAMAFCALSNGMRLAVTAPLAEISRDRNLLFVQIVVALVVIMLLSALLALVLTRRLVRPLQELNEAAQKIAEGDLSVAISSQTKDEVGDLAASFQKTVGHLQEYISYINGLAYRDSLTGVKNKTAYLEAERRMDERIRTGRPEFAVVVMDINNLKWVNDHRGHDFGDLLIVAASSLICKTFQHSPVFRVGGDEFVALLEHEDLARCPELLKQFEAGMREYNLTAHPDSRLSIARGVAVYRSATDLTFSSVFKRADDAMYRNKAATKQVREDRDAD